MRQYFLYHVLFTGGSLWKYVEADRLDEAPTYAKTFLTTDCFPGFPTFVESRRHGRIACRFFAPSAWVPDTVAFGTAEDSSVVFELQRLSPEGEYLLAVRDGDSFQLWETEDKSVCFLCGGKTVASVVPDPSIKIADACGMGEQVKRLAISEEAAPELELICAAASFGVLSPGR